MTKDAESIDDLFEAEEEAKEAETEAKGETEPDDQTDSDESKTEDSTDAEPPAAEEDQTVPLSALIKLRQDNQALKREAKRLKSKYEPDQDAPDPGDDPEGYKKWVRDTVEKERLEELADTSRENAIAKYSDYEEKEKFFTFMCLQDSSLTEKMRVQNDPAEFAYTTAKTELDKHEKSIEDRVIERLTTQGKLQKEKSESVSVSNLIKSTGAGKNSEATVKEITAIDEVFDD